MLSNVFEIAARTFLSNSHQTWHTWSMCQYAKTRGQSNL